MKDIETALKLHQSGNLSEAEEIYSQLISEMPDNADIHNLYGVLKMQQGKLDESLELLKKAIKLSPDPIYFENLGLVYFIKQDYSNAANYFEKSLETQLYKETVEKLIFCYKKTGKQHLALKYSIILYEEDKKNINLIREIAQLADNINDYSTAINFYKKSLKLDPNDWVGENNLGLIYEKVQNLQEAKNCYNKSLIIKNNFEARKNIGVLYRRENNFKKSEENLEQALRLNPNDWNTHLSLGMTYLKQKKFSIGYKHYFLKNPHIKNQYKNYWDGSPKQQSSILIFCDGGFGDYIMFSRYLYALKDYFRHIILLVPPDLERLFVKNFPFASVETSIQNANYDFSASIMDLPYLLNIDFDNIPFAEGYLSIDCKSELTDNKSSNIGLFWHGNQRVYPNRSIPFQTIKTILKNNVNFYSFQKDEEQKTLPTSLTNLAPVLNDFYDTACFMKSLDLMITIDSAAAHLAGALGVKTFLLLPYSSEWRWFTDTKQTPWYRSITIFRQPKEGDWESILKQIANNF